MHGKHISLPKKAKTKIFEIFVQSVISTRQLSIEDN